jgi:integrase/recombinase XerD
MLSTLSSCPRWLAQMRSTPASPFLDGFVAALTKAGYHTKTMQTFVRGAAHFSLWLTRRGHSLTELGASSIPGFKQHFASCRCAGFNRRSRCYSRQSDGRGGEQFVRHLQTVGAIARSTSPAPQEPRLVSDFCRWMQQHRGAKDETLRIYGRLISDALISLGDDPSQYDARRLRAFILQRAPRYGRSKAKLLVTALRVFIRYLITQNLCPAGLDAAIPTIAGWKLASLPRYLQAVDVERVLTSCDPTTAIGARDRAVLLLLCRLGLRAGDVANLRWRDIDWRQATVEVMGKSQRAARMPLSQEVGDALLRHLNNTPGAAPSDPIFLNSMPPLGRSLGSGGVSDLASRAIKRAGVQAPTRGAHVLRHSAATSLLADGASLQSIGVVLRHRLLDTTTIYAKVDFKVLRTLAMPWPEVSP